MHARRSVPRTVAAHMALLAPHLGCGAYPIRSGIVTAVGHLLQGAFEHGGRDGADAQGEVLLLAACDVMQTELPSSMFADPCFAQSWRTVTGREAEPGGECRVTDRRAALANEQTAGRC